MCIWCESPLGHSKTAGQRLCGNPRERATSTGRSGETNALVSPRCWTRLKKRGLDAPANWHALRPGLVDAAYVATVNFADDSIRRFVVRLYAFDPIRRERRHQVVAVVDRRREFENLMDQFSDDLTRRRAAGQDVDAREHYTGSVLEPGDLRRAANARYLKRAVAHGVWPVDAQELDLPASVAVFQIGD
jgi:hypothetical protein